jgi:branched-chain amino acid transport system permease protein
VRQFVNYTLNGITLGMVYAATALAIVLIWRATRVVNFATGAMGMFTTFIAVSLLDRHVGYWAAFVAALICGFVLGGVVERVLIRPVESKPPANAIIVTLGLFVLLEALAGMIWGGGIRSVPAHFSLRGFVIGTRPVAFSPFNLFVVVAVVLTMLGLLFLFRATAVGLRMRAAAFEPEVARLLGVRVSRLLTLGWALAAVLGSLAALLVAPLNFLSPNYMDTILVFGFTAAVLGSLDSPLGALVGGLVMGLSISYIGAYIDVRLETIGALVILTVVLMFRPEGLFTRTAPRRV